MHSQEWIERELVYQRDLLLRILVLLTKDTAEIEEIEQAVKQKLSFIKIALGGEMPVGPATLSVGDKKTATVLGFDQNGAAFTGSIPDVTWADDNEPVVQDAPTTTSDGLTAVAAGVANLTATVQGPNGPLSDTESITVLAAAPVLSSIKISID